MISKYATMRHLRITLTQVVLSLLCSLVSITGFARTVSSKTALASYINNNDKSFVWQVTDSMQTEAVNVYRLRLVSQTWRQIPWIHEMEIIVPRQLEYSDALLFVSGGSLGKESQEPNLHGWDDYVIKAMSQIASDCHAVTAIIWQVPRQPLFNGLFEDEIVSYTFHHFLEDHDYTWPLLFPMAKSAIRAMDAVQEFANNKKIAQTPQNFLISGFSKRGWTSWMAAATGDKRIKAIAPAVIDILNMPVNVPYQKHMYGSYSVQIQDYVKLGITEAFQNSHGSELKNMIDPYSYRKSIKIPKLLLLGTNDEYWTVDAVKNYLYGLKGTTLINYTPNTGHSLGDKVAAFSTLESFFWQTINNVKYTTFKSSVRQSGKEIMLKFKSSNTPEEVILWEAESTNRDFRKSEFKSKKIDLPASNNKVIVSLPNSNYKAFFVMAKYKNPVSNTFYTLTSRMYFCDSTKLYDKPYKP